jgi:hypothetical protein
MSADHSVPPLRDRMCGSDHDHFPRRAAEKRGRAINNAEQIVGDSFEVGYGYYGIAYATEWSGAKSLVAASRRKRPGQTAEKDLLRVACFVSRPQLPMVDFPLPKSRFRDQAFDFGSSLRVKKEDCEVVS